MLFVEVYLNGYSSTRKIVAIPTPSKRYIYALFTNKVYGKAAENLFLYMFFLSKVFVRFFRFFRHYNSKGIGTTPIGERDSCNDYSHREYNGDTIPRVI